MAEDAAARLVQDEIAQSSIGFDGGALFPERPPGGRRDATDNDIANLALGVAADDVDGLGATHREI